MVFSNLRFIKWRVIFRAEESGQLPLFLGSTVRGIIGHSMRKLACIAPNVKCHLCDYASDCDYAAYFNPPGNIAGSVKPYVLKLPLQEKIEWRKSDLLTFDITFFGDSTLEAEYYLEGIIGMNNYGWGAKRLKFSLQQIINLKDQSLIWSGGQTWRNNIQTNYVQDEGKYTSSALLRFNSPIRVLIKQQLMRQLDFTDIIKSIMTRIKLVFHAYSGVLLEWNEEELLADAKRIITVEEDWRYIDFKRYSLTYQRQLHLPAITGYARFEGDLTSFTPLLEIGQLLQIGKNTTHGFGSYDLFYA